LEDTLKKQLAAAVLMLTISAGMASAEFLTPGRKCATTMTVTATSSWTAKAQAAWKYVISFAKR
jgi:hypothetical protein